ncbi:hypothetical protein COLO4_03800 [Corchorus olitorius]|uniref:Uncharacterized protein n=1 Tax=Corchorus olitorius TaxID=93759 RepID=A0A1R3KWK2_9ROSI|nr:hypothetical protein COLO4_03800 [Corchorus olitorius]
MTENLVPSNLQLSYVISITIPQPTIRIRIPKVLAKAMRRRNNNFRSSEKNDDDDDDKDENGSSNNNNKKKKWGKCKKSLRKRVGAMFSNVFGNKKLSSPDESDEKGDEVDENGDEVDKLVVETKELVVKMATKRIETVQGTAVATGFGVAKSLLVKKLETTSDQAGDEGKERQEQEGNIVSKSRRTKRGNINNNSYSIVVAGDKTGSQKVTGKAEYSDDLPPPPPSKVPLVTRNGSSSRRRLKVSFMTVKKLMGRDSGKHELCKKRILMGGKCRPLGAIQYDENGFLLPEIIP